MSRAAIGALFGIVVAIAASALAGVGQNPALPCGDIVYAPGIGPRGSFPPFSASTNVSATGLGLLKCNAFELDCKMVVRRLALDVVQSIAGVQCAAGIYQRSGTSAVALARMPVSDCSDAVVVTADGGAAIEADLDNVVTLQPYTEYLGCAAFSIRGVSTVKYEAPRPIPLFLALGQYSSYNADLAACTSCTTELSAKFNAACVGNADPWTCCTGAATGTCTGLPATITTLTPQFTHGPLLKLGR